MNQKKKMERRVGRTDNLRVKHEVEAFRVALWYQRDVKPV